MLRSVKEIKDAHVHAEDGQIGTVKALYFSDKSWQVRHFLVDAGSLLKDRDVLLSPGAVRVQDKTSRVSVVCTGLTKDEVKSAPEAATDPPVAVQQRNAHLAASPYPVTGESTIGPAGTPIDVRALDADGRPAGAPGNSDGISAAGDPHLRSTREVRGYRARSRDGEIGHVEDFVVDTDNWTIRYVAVDTRNWLPGKKVLVASPWVVDVSWEDAEVSVDLDSFEIKGAPGWDPDLPVDRTLEEQVYAYYGRTPYWAFG